MPPSSKNLRPASPESAWSRRYPSGRRTRSNSRRIFSSSSTIRIVASAMRLLLPYSFPSQRRQPEHDFRALPLLAIDRQLPTVLLHQPLGVRQAEPGPEVFGGEERIEDLLEVFWADPASGIHNPHDHRRRCAALSLHAGGDGKGPALRHGFSGVDHEIHQRLLDLIRVHHQVRHVGCDAHLFGDVRYSLQIPPILLVLITTYIVRI